MIELIPIDFKTAKEFINNHHRHHVSPIGWKVGVGIWDGIKLRGVLTLGRPVARKLDDGWTLEVNRCCTDGVKNGCSMLYGAACRVAKALGYKRLITYTLKDETGVSLLAAGWKSLYDTPGRTWSCKSRPRINKHPIEQKTLWEAPI